MSQSNKYKRISTWNNIRHKPDIVDVVAKDDDICLKINQMWFLLQRDNGNNNCVAFLTPGKHMTPRKIMCSMFDFIYRLATEYNIEYITVKGKPGKYNFVSRFFPDNVVLDPKRDSDGLEVRYAHLDDKAIKKLDLLRRLDGKQTE